MVQQLRLKLPFRGPGFCSQQSSGDSQLFVALVPGDLTPSCGLPGHWCTPGISMQLQPKLKEVNDLKALDRKADLADNTRGLLLRSIANLFWYLL